MCEENVKVYYSFDKSINDEKDIVIFRSSFDPKDTEHISSKFFNGDLK